MRQTWEHEQASTRQLSLGKYPKHKKLIIYSKASINYLNKICLDFISIIIIVIIIIRIRIFFFYKNAKDYIQRNRDSINIGMESNNIFIYLFIYLFIYFGPRKAKGKYTIL